MHNRKIGFLFLFLLATLCVNAGGKQPAQTIQRLLAFTTTNSVKLEATFVAAPKADDKYSVRITDDKTGKELYSGNVQGEAVPGDPSRLTFRVSGLTPQLWQPTAPVMYKVQFTTWSSAEVKELRIGFRMFESRDGHILLNGKPIFLRGIAINPPSRGIPDSVERSRKFAEEYVRFMKSINVNIIRIPNDETWYNVCDELGMMVFGGNYSGTVDGEKPPKDYDSAIRWYETDAFAAIASHPSLMVYAMTNEVPFEGRVAQQWEKFLAFAYPKLHDWDDTRLYIANAGYGYGKSGDICDLHRYWGWYYCSPFNFINIRDNSKIIPFAKKVQPITFTECVGNYTGPDGSYNLTPDHKNPGSQLNWTGHADWASQPSLADEHQSYTFKKATELFRRMRVINPELSGVFPFTILYYNWNNVQQFIDMDPKPVTKQARLSYQPLLVSWENWTTQVYAGTTLKPILHIVNDDNAFNDLQAGATLVYELRDAGDQAVSTGSIQLPAIPYYSTWQQQLSIPVPANAVAGNYRLLGKIIRDGKILSENEDPVFVGNKSIITSGTPVTRKILLYDPSGITAAALDKSGIRYQRIAAFQSIPAGASLIIGENGADAQLVKAATVLRQFIQRGGHVVCLRQDAEHFLNVNKISKAPFRNVTTELDVPSYPPPARPSRNGLNVNPERPEHPVFDGVRREELRVWSDYTNWTESKPGFPAVYPVTDGFVPDNKEDIGSIAVLANYGVALEGIAIAEVFDGKGSLLLTGLDLARRAGIDPIADRMLANMIRYAAGNEAHDNYVLITAPIVWGDYATEKGVLTGVNSGLMVHGVPRIPDNSKSKITVTRIGNRFLGAGGGFNTRPGIQYVAYGRRMFGPYNLRGFGNVPDPVDTTGNRGEGYFWCRIPAGKSVAHTTVWNQADEPLPVTIRINNDTPVTQLVPANQTVDVPVPVHTTSLKMWFKGDRRLVLLQTSFDEK